MPRRYAGLGPSRARTGFFGSWTMPMNGCRFAKFYASVCDNNFSSLVASLFSWRCLAASTFYFLQAANNLRPPSVDVSTHTSASNVIAFQSPAMPNARMSLSNQSSLFLPTPSSPHCIIKVSEHESLWQPPAAQSAPAHKSLLVCNVVSMLSHRVISRARMYEGCETRPVGVRLPRPLPFGS